MGRPERPDEENDEDDDNPLDPWNDDVDVWNDLDEEPNPFSDDPTPQPHRPGQKIPSSRIPIKLLRNFSPDEMARFTCGRIPMSLDRTRDPIRVSEPLADIMERLRQPTLPGVSLDPTTPTAAVTIKVGSRGQVPEAEIRKPFTRPRVGEKLLRRTGAYEIKAIQGDSIVIMGKGGTTGERLIPIAMLERAEGVDGDVVWRLKEDQGKALHSFPRADGQGFGPMRQRT